MGLVLAMTTMVRVTVFLIERGNNARHSFAVFMTNIAKRVQKVLVFAVQHVITSLEQLAKYVDPVMILIPVVLAVLVNQGARCVQIPL